MCEKNVADYSDKELKQRFDEISREIARRSNEKTLSKEQAEEISKRST